MVPLSVLIQEVGMFGIQSPTLQDRAKGWAEFSIMPLLVVKSSVVSALLLPQSPSEIDRCNQRSTLNHAIKDRNVSRNIQWVTNKIHKQK